MAAAYQWGYRGAMIVAGAVPLLLAEVVRLERLLRGDGRAHGGGRARRCWRRRAKGEHDDSSDCTTGGRSAGAGG